MHPDRPFAFREQPSAPRLPRQPRALGPLLAAFAAGAVISSFADDADAQHHRHGGHHARHHREAAPSAPADASDLGPDRGREGGVIPWTDEDETRMRMLCNASGEGQQAREVSARSLALCRDFAHRRLGHEFQVGALDPLADASFVSRLRRTPGRPEDRAGEYGGLAQGATVDEVRALVGRFGGRSVRVDYRLTRYAELTDTRRRRGPELDLALMNREAGVDVEEQEFLQETLQREPNAHAEAGAQEALAEAVAPTPTAAFLSAAYLLSARFAAESGSRQRGAFDVRTGGTELTYAQESSSQLVYGLRVDAFSQDAEGAWHVRLGARPAVRGRE